MIAIERELPRAVHLDQVRHVVLAVLPSARGVADAHHDFSAAVASSWPPCPSITPSPHDSRCGCAPSVRMKGRQPLLDGVVRCRRSPVGPGRRASGRVLANSVAVLRRSTSVTPSWASVQRAGHEGRVLRLLEVRGLTDWSTAQWSRRLLDACSCRRRWPQRREPVRR